MGKKIRWIPGIVGLCLVLGASGCAKSAGAGSSYALDQRIGTFAASGSVVKDTTREIYLARLQKNGDKIVLDIMGNGFLYNMVRIIAGTLIDIGRGKLGTDTFKKMLQTNDRVQGGMTAPPQGLILQRIYYETVPTYAQYLCEKSALDGPTLA